ncbi:retrovirus-related pol polyprotein from transposon TNT 1-94 [Tanacetum coccineum]
MLCKPKSFYDEANKVAIGYKNPLYLSKAKRVQPALYSGQEIIKTNHDRIVVHDSEDTLEIAETTRKQMNEKMNDPMCVKKKVKIAPPDYSKENHLATFTPQKQLTPEQIFWSDDILKMKAKALKEKAKSAKPITAMTVYPPNTPAKLVPKVLPTKKHFEGIQKALIKEIKEMKEVFEQMEAEMDQHAVDKKCDEIERKNLLIENENLIVDCLSKEVFYTATNYVLTVSRFSDMHDAHTAAQKRIAELEAENSNLKSKIQNDDHDEMIKHSSKLEVEHLNLQLKYQHLKEHRGNKKSVTSSDAPAFDLVFKHSEADLVLDFKALDFQNKDLTAKVNALHDLNERFRAKNEKFKQHYKELYDSIKLTRAKTIEKTTSLLTEIENLKAQINGKQKCVTMPVEKPKVLAPGTLREIVEEARVKQPLDNVLEYACLYTKHSQELKKRVTFVEPCETSTNNSQTHIVQQKMKKTNEPMIPSTGVKDAISASGSKPRSNTKNDRTLPAKCDKKEVEVHPRKNKSSVKRKNRVDSSISYKHTVINSNSNYVCKTCNKCLISFNHDKCVVKSLKFVKKPPVNKVWRVKQVKQVWQTTRKLFTNVGYQWNPTGRKFTLGEQCPLTRFTKSKVVLVKQPKSVSTSAIVITERLSNTSQKPLTRYRRKNKQEKAISADTPTATVIQSIDDSMKLTVVQIVLWYLDSGCSKHMTGDRLRLRNFVKKFIGIVRFGNDHFGAIMGYRDYVIDLEVAFRKHSCHVRDVNGVDLIKGNRGTNLYTISVEDMMKSSPICLLSKASKNKSWLWHRRLNHLNFGTINDLA